MQMTMLEEELEATKMRTAHQLSEMATHLAVLTDEIHFLRNETPSLSSSAATNGKQHAPVEPRLSRPYAPDSGSGNTHEKVVSIIFFLYSH